MARGSNWSGVKGDYTFEAFKGDDGVWNDGRETQAGILPEKVQDVLNVRAGSQPYAEVTINFTSEGYYQPAKLCGAPEDCYPEEGSDERFVSSVVFGFDDGSELKLDGADADTVFDAMFKQVEAVELEWDDSINED